MSGAALDMTLDDPIKQNKKPGGGGGQGRGRGSGPSPAHRLNYRTANRANPYSASKAMAFPGQFGGAQSSAIETGTKLYISNLDYGVSNEDIKLMISLHLFPRLVFHKLRAVSWKKPESLKLNADGSHSMNGSGAGWILRNSFGYVIAAESIYLGSQSILYAEAFAIWRGLQYAHNSNGSDWKWSLIQKQLFAASTNNRNGLGPSLASCGKLTPFCRRRFRCNTFSERRTCLLMPWLN